METLCRHAVACVAVVGCAALFGGTAAAAAELPAEVHLTGVPSPGVHHYRATTEVVEIEPDGRRKPMDVFELWLDYAVRPGAADLVTCRRFTVSLGGKPKLALPSLENWAYPFRETAGGLDERGYIFGIDQAKFDQIADAGGTVLPPTAAYMVYNAFVDFHGFGQVFARRTSAGGGIQDLRRFGQSLLHASANSEPPVSLGNTVAKGSTFKNGAVTLELKGVGSVGGRRCAVVGFDSGASSFQMKLTPMPQMTVETRGGSRYAGDLYVDLETQWLQRATLLELVVSQTTVSTLPQKIASVHERRLLVEALDAAEFEAGALGLRSARAPRPPRNEKSRR